jgi:hypothetical protein
MQQQRINITTARVGQDYAMQQQHVREIQLQHSPQQMMECSFYPQQFQPQPQTEAQDYSYGNLRLAPSKLTDTNTTYPCHNTPAGSKAIGNGGFLWHRELLFTQQIDIGRCCKTKHSYWRSLKCSSRLHTHHVIVFRLHSNRNYSDADY